MNKSLTKEKDGHYYLMSGELRAECPYSGILMMQDLSGKPVPIRYPCSSKCALFKITEIKEDKVITGNVNIRLHCAVSFCSSDLEVKDNTSTLTKL